MKNMYLMIWIRYSPVFLKMKQKKFILEEIYVRKKLELFCKKSAFKNL